MKAAEIRELTGDEIVARIQQLEEELFRLRFRSATAELENPMLLRTLRRDVARLHTVLTERKLAGEGAGR
ncbi:MAG TPA: 50S ribosomal protein L29 [Longimicrobiaceae bacterium]|jgi:large subunit ribosomal protein L29|nr:50S ribosomal protein L29 [Longimicrobiaceae bacterium]